MMNRNKDTILLTIHACFTALLVYLLLMNPVAPVNVPSDSGSGTPQASNMPVKLTAKQDNKKCFVCHEAFEKDKLSIRHQQKNVSCARCHGASKAHMADNTGLTPPDIMFPRAKIKAACFKCHKEDMLVKKSEHKTSFAPTSTKVCTDCHGKKHKEKEREIIWDKVTGKLLMPTKR